MNQINFPCVVSFNEESFNLDVLFIRDGEGVVIDTSNGEYDTPYKVGYISQGFNKIAYGTWDVISDNKEEVSEIIEKYRSYVETFLSNNKLTGIRSFVARSELSDQRDLLTKSIEFLNKFGV